MSRARWIVLSVLLLAIAAGVGGRYVEGFGFFGGGRRSPGGPGSPGVPVTRTIEFTDAGCVQVTPTGPQDLSGNRSWLVDGSGCASGTDLTGESFITRTAEANLTDEFALASLATGALINTTTTGIPTVFAGESCTNQVFTGVTASLDFTCTTLSLTGAYFASQGTTMTVLHGNAAGNLSFGAVHLVNDVTGLPGSDTQMLFNDGGAIGADAENVYNKTTNVQTVGSVVTTQQAGVSINPYNTGAGQTGELRFLELAAGGSNYVALRSGDARGGNIVYVWPTDDPTAGQVLSAGAPSGGVSVLDWVDQSAGSGYATIDDEDTPLTQRTTLNFEGAGVTCADDTNQTTCTIPGGSSVAQLCFLGGNGVPDVDCNEQTTYDLLMWNDTLQEWFNSPGADLALCDPVTDAVTFDPVEASWSCVTLAAGSGDITDVWGCTSGNCNALTAAAGDSFNAASADSIIPATQSTTLPGTCTEGQLHQDTNSGGCELYVCTATNTWKKFVCADDLAVADGATLGIAAFTAADFNTSSGVVSLDYTNAQAASASNKGFLTSADYTTLKKGYLNVGVSSVRLPGTNACQIDNSETNPRILCDATTAENFTFSFMMPPDYGSALQLRIDYSMLSCTSGGVSVNVSVMKLATGADVNTESYDTANNCDDASVPGTAGHPDQIVCVLTTNDSAVASLTHKIKVERATGDSADTCSGDMEFLGIMLEYTKSQMQFFFVWWMCGLVVWAWQKRKSVAGAVLVASLLFVPLAHAGVDFDGSDDLINMGDVNDVSGAFSILAWIRPDAVGAHMMIVSKYDLGDTADQTYYLSVFTDSKLRALIQSGTLPNIRTATTVLSAGTWYHVAMTWDGNTANLPTIYLNGVNDDGSSAGPSMAVGPLNITAQFIIGARENGAGFATSFNGVIDDVRIYTGRALSAMEVANVAASRLRYGYTGTVLSGYWPLDECADGASGNIVSFKDRASVNNGSGDDGANNTGLTCMASPILSYPGGVR